MKLETKINEYLVINGNKVQKMNISFHGHELYQQGRHSIYFVDSKGNVGLQVYEYGDDWTCLKAEILNGGDGE